MSLCETSEIATSKNRYYYIAICFPAISARSSRPVCVNDRNWIHWPKLQKEKR